MGVKSFKNHYKKMVELNSIRAKASDHNKLSFAEASGSNSPSLKLRRVKKKAAWKGSLKHKYILTSAKL